MSIKNPAPNEKQADLIQVLKDDFEEIEKELMLNLPNNRERSLALTNLEQCSMWATKAILQGENVVAPRRPN